MSPSNDGNATPVVDNIPTTTTISSSTGVVVTPTPTPTPTTTPRTSNTPRQKRSPASYPPVTYQNIVVDANAIIKAANLSKSGIYFYTVPGVMKEIVDKKARSYLQNLPYTLVQREPSAAACKAVATFSRKTGDYRELSLVDLQIIALQYDLEVEGCGDASHLRTEPKRRLGGGRMVPLNDAEKKKEEGAEKKEDSKIDDDAETKETEEEKTGMAENGMFEIEEESGSESDDDSSDEESTAPKSWATMVHPSASSNATAKEEKTEEQMVQHQLASMNISNNNNNNNNNEEEEHLGGQFSDAEETEEEDNDGEQYAASDAEFSDEECDVYILDPEEVEANKKKREKEAANVVVSQNNNNNNTLSNDFPSLADAMNAVPYESEDNFDDNNNNNDDDIDEEELRKQSSLQPKGKHWNSFLKYKDVKSSKGLPKMEDKEKEWEREKEKLRLEVTMEQNQLSKELQQQNKHKNNNRNTSRIMGGTEISGQSSNVVEDDDDDDGGWVTVKNIHAVKENKGFGFGTKVDTMSNSNNTDTTNTQMTKTTAAVGPSESIRCACATTDFAMQNVILQMGMRLLNVNGVVVRKVKHWVTRCATCFTVYGGNNNKDKTSINGRLFCDRCGGSHLERISASVNAKTGRYRLYMNKRRRKQNNTRGTKYSLPRPGRSNVGKQRFQGELLLREDQLLMGAWHQKVKRGSNSKVNSMFGSDIANDVGLGDLTKRNDIHVGFGRRNPNSSKFGRERRGKKKKCKDGDNSKACGLKRY